MPDSPRREWLLIAGLLLLAFLVSLIGGPDPEADPYDFRRSTYHNSPAGTRALYLTLQELGIPVGRRHRALIGLDSLTGALALLAPASPPTPEEAGRLVGWIERGGTLVYAAGNPLDPVLDSLGLRLAPGPNGSDDEGERRSERPPDGRAVADSGGMEWTESVGDSLRARAVRSVVTARFDTTFSARTLPHEWTRGVERVDGFHYVFNDSSELLLAGRGTPLLVTVDGAAAALTFRLGGGRVIAWSDAAPLANDTLRESGAAVVFARGAAAVLDDGERLRFDEYHQGYRGGGGVLAAMGGFLSGTAAGFGTLQLAAVGLLLLIVLGRRFGAPITLVEGERRSPLEHVDALAEAYRQASARKTARRLLLAGFARRLGRPGRGGAAADPRLLKSLEYRPNVNGARVRGILAALESGDDADLVALARELDQLLNEVHRK